MRNKRKILPGENGIFHVRHCEENYECYLRVRGDVPAAVGTEAYKGESVGYSFLSRQYFGEEIGVS